MTKIWPGEKLEVEDNDIENEPESYLQVSSLHFFGRAVPYTVTQRSTKVGATILLCVSGRSLRKQSWVSSDSMAYVVSFWVVLICCLRNSRSCLLAYFPHSSASLPPMI